MPLWFAGDPAPQQLTAPCRKYSGRLHHPIEQAVYRVFFLENSRDWRAIGSATAVLASSITFRLISRSAVVSALRTDRGQTSKLSPRQKGRRNDPAKRGIARLDPICAS